MQNITPSRTTDCSCSDLTIIEIDVSLHPEPTSTKASTGLQNITEDPCLSFLSTHAVTVYLIYICLSTIDTPSDDFLLIF